MLQLTTAVPEIPIGTSLAVIVALLTAATAASLFKARRNPELRAHAASLREGRREPVGHADGADRQT